MTHEFKHPKYYKELRTRNKDQAISLRAQDAERERASDPGLKPQAASSKPQATDPQAASDKLQAPSNKRQTSSRKRQAP